MKHRLLLLIVLLSLPAWAEPHVKIRVGSKAFPESWILGDALTILAREAGAEVVHQDNMGATQIVYEALRQGKIDVYPEYTGTISEVFLKDLPHPTTGVMLDALARDRIGMSYPLGFNDSYGIAVRREVQEKLGVATLSDLARHPELILGLTPEFVGRKDGWAPLQAAYALKPQQLKQMQHELGYQALSAGKLDAVDVYTTDAQIARLNLVVLQDDKQFFPRYDAVLLYRADLPRRAPDAWGAMLRLVGQISEEQMIAANARVVLENQTSQESARILLKECLGQESAPLIAVRGWDWSSIGANTVQHLYLVAASLLVAIAVGIPLGVLASRSPLLASVTLTGTGLLQTVPSLALLAFLVPIMGVGLWAALTALFLYSLLPIVRNTYTGLTTIPGNLAEAAEAIGLSPLSQLLVVRLPMASPSILAGIKTSAVINVGTATLAALVGAGGLGQPILQGIALIDTPMILQGAIPAALLALAVQGGFDLLERFVVPRGLRL